MDKKARKVSISLKTKFDIIKTVDNGGCSKTAICQKFGMKNSTLSTILKNREKIVETYEQFKFEPERKRMRKSKFEDLDAALLAWLKQLRSQNVPISGPLIMEKANGFAEEMGIEFSANPGWLNRFKKRNFFIFKCEYGESQQVLPVLSDWLQSTLPEILNEYEAKNIFNADETELLFNCLSEKPQTVKKEQRSDGKTSKEKFTVLIGCNSDGTEKLPLLIIGKNKNPRCLKKIKKLPVEYVANPKGWMTSETFKSWVLNLDKKFHRQNRKIALIIDSCPAHPTEVDLKAIKMIFLPNTSGVLQPCDQGITQNLNFHYRKLLQRKYRAASKSKEQLTIDLLDALHLMRNAWNLVNPHIIKNCFKHAGFSEVLQSEEEAESLETKLTEIDTTFTDLIGPGLIKEYEEEDENLYNVLTDAEILNPANCNSEMVILKSENNPDEYEELPVPSVGEVMQMLKRIRRYFEVHSDGELYENIYSLEQFVENKICKF